MDPMWIGITVGLACLALGCLLGWFANRQLDKGGRTTDPPPEPEPLADAVFKQLRANALAERAAQHADWDAQWRALCPPEPGVVWRRKPHKITDFNN